MSDTSQTTGNDSASEPATYYHDIPHSVAQAAHAGTSFSPERRGEQEVESYAQTLAHDYVAMSKYATTDEKRATLAEEFDRYRAGYRSRYLARLEARSRTMSTMITGGSNFPTRRNAKRGATADKRTEDLIEFRERALDAIRKTLQPELRPVMAGDSDAVERLQSKIAKAEEFQARAKLVNATIRKNAKLGIEAQVAAVVALGYPESSARNVLTPDFAGRTGIPAYELTNNNANIRRMKERLATISADKVAEVTEVAGELAKLEDCPADNRVRLFYPGKPDAETRGRLKSAGFRWAPSLGCWQAYRNHRTLETARKESGACKECNGSGEVYTSGQVTVECDGCVQS